MESVTNDRYTGYSSFFALSFHWECDSTDVLEDVNAFHAILDTVSGTKSRQAEVLALS